MADVSRQMTVVVEGGCAYVVVSGRACAEAARDFKRFVEGRRAEGVHRFVLELSRCLLMDSTFSGVLAGLVAGGGASPVRFVLVSPNERITDLLDNLGVLPLVEVVAADALAIPAGPASALPGTEADRRGDAECCLEAHRILMALRPENVARFATLEKFLAEEVARGTSGTADGR